MGDAAEKRLSQHALQGSIFDDTSLPAAIIKRSGLMHNIRWMQDFADHYQVALAPHGKTTMLPDVFKLQMAQGAWGITLATVDQVLAAYQNGVNRIIMANQLVGRAAVKKLVPLLRDPEVKFCCLIDSEDAVMQLTKWLAEFNVSLDVLIEVGVSGGRGGCRSAQQVETLAGIVKTYQNIHLIGVEFYEGVIAKASVESISAFIDGVVEVSKQLKHCGLFDCQKPIISGAGSAWYDVVAQCLSKHNATRWFQPIIRPGCYVTHDAGIYQALQDDIDQRCDYAANHQPSLVSCLEVWAYILSIPEPGLAIVGLGKRDSAFDAGLPTPIMWVPLSSPTEYSLNPISQLQTVKIMDQHCMLKFATDAPIRVGDAIGFSTSHPCLTFDKWRSVILVDDKYNLEGVLPSFF